MLKIVKPNYNCCFFFLYWSFYLRRNISRKYVHCLGPNFQCDIEIKNSANFMLSYKEWSALLRFDVLSVMHCSRYLIVLLSFMLFFFKGFVDILLPLILKTKLHNLYIYLPVCLFALLHNCCNTDHTECNWLLWLFVL